MIDLPSVLLWLVALASVALLLGAGYVFAAARLRARLEMSRGEVMALEGRISSAREDPFGELKVLADQLLRIRQRLERLGTGTGQPADAELADSKTIPPPEPAALPVPERPPATAELEADLDLVRREVHTKERRIEELEIEKRRLAERVVSLEEEVRSVSLATASKRPAFIPVTTVEGPATGDGLASLIDTLQQEADKLRSELAEREERIGILERSDSTGVLHELERIRRELQARTEELSAAQDRLSLTEKGAVQAKARAVAAEQEKETMATRALETSAELRGTQEKIRDLERQLASRQPAPGLHELESAMAPTAWPTAPPTTTPGRPLATSAATPSRPAAAATPSRPVAAAVPSRSAVAPPWPPSGQYPAAKPDRSAPTAPTSVEPEPVGAQPVATKNLAYSPPTGQHGAVKPARPGPQPAMAMPAGPGPQPVATKTLAFPPPTGQRAAAKPVGPGPQAVATKTLAFPPPTGQHAAAKPGRTLSGHAPAEQGDQDPFQVLTKPMAAQDPFEVLTKPSGPPLDLHDVHNKPTNTHPALAPPPRPLDVHTKPTATHPSIPPPRRTGVRAGLPPAPLGSEAASAAESAAAPVLGATNPDGDPKPQANPDRAAGKGTGSFTRPRRPTGSIFPEPPTRGGDGSK